MNLFNNGLFRYLEKNSPSQITDQLDTKAIINFCQYALEVQMYASDSYTGSNEGPVKLNELDLPSVSTSIDIPQVSAKTLTNNQKDLCNMICVVNRESINLPETLRNLKEKMKLSFKEKDKSALVKTKYHGVYQQDNVFIAYFEKIPGQKTEKIGEFKNSFEAGKAYDQYIMKKDLNHRRKSKEESYFPLNFPSRSRSRSKSSDSRRNNRKPNNYNNNNANYDPSRRSNESNNKRYHNHDYRNKDFKYRRDNEKSPYKQSHNKEASVNSRNVNGINKPVGYSNSNNARNSKDSKDPSQNISNKTVPTINTQKNINYNNSSNNFNNNSNTSSNNKNNQNSLKAMQSTLSTHNNNHTATPTRDSLGTNNSLSNKKKNINNQYSNNMYQNYQYPNNYNTYAKTTTAGYYMNDSQNNSYNYGSGYYANNSNYYQNYPQNSLTHNLYNQGNVYQSYLQTQPSSILNTTYNTNNQFSSQNLSNPNDLSSYGYKRNYNQNSNNYNNLNYNLASNASYNLGKINSASTYEDDAKKSAITGEDKNVTKSDTTQILGKKEGDEKKTTVGEPSTIVIQSDINQNINY